jgi:hypothetical protein
MGSTRTHAAQVPERATAVRSGGTRPTLMVRRTALAPATPGTRRPPRGMLEIGENDDPLEREADRAAPAVVGAFGVAGDAEAPRVSAPLPRRRA